MRKPRLLNGVFEMSRWKEPSGFNRVRHADTGTAALSRIPPYSLNLRIGTQAIQYHTVHTGFNIWL